jgi:hypothetical protein
LIVLAAVAAYLFGYRRFASQNEEALQQISSGRQQLQSIQGQPIAGQGWREPLQAVQANYGQQQELIEHLVNRGVPDVIIGEVSAWRELCLKLAGPAEEAPVAARLASLMNDPVREDIQRKADEIVEARTATGVGITTGRNYPTVSPELKITIVREINRILQSPEFYREDVWAGVPVLRGDTEALRALVAGIQGGEEAPTTDAEREARDQAINARVVQLEQKRQRIEAMMDRREELSEKDLFWLNRLLLEAALPEHIADSSLRRKFQAPFQYVTVPHSTLYQYTGLWKGVYATRVGQLRSVMQENFLGYGENCLDVASYTQGYVPTETEMQWQEEAYWIQRYVVDALAGLNNVPQESPVMTEDERLSIRRQRLEEDRYVVPLLRSVRFAPQPERMLHYSHSESFRPLPIDVTLIMSSRYLNLLHHALVEEVPTLEVTGFRVNRYGQYSATLSRAAPVITGTGPQGPGLGRPGEEFMMEDRPPRGPRDRREYRREETAPERPAEGVRITGFRVYPYGEVEVPSGAGFQLQGKLVEVVIRCYIKEGAPGSPLFQPEEREPMEGPEFEGR